MKLIVIIVLMLICFNSQLNSITHHIKQDGSGDFTTIQEGINASTNSDTVLVYSGTYLENINYNGKNITVGSLYLTTGDQQYINQTVIDGNQLGSVVTIENGENENALLYGFTIMNGSGNPWVNNSIILAGGGIYIKNSSPTLSSCIVSNNSTRFGGGIYFGNSNSFLINMTISFNNAFRIGGGICLDHSSTISFDNNNLSNIYLNYSHYGSDIYKRWDCLDTLYVFVDTFTVMQPDYYFVSSTSTLGIQLDDIIMDIQHSKIEPVNADLFVSQDGSNDNSGLSLNDPLQTINYAYALIASDSLHPNTIHLADGVYSNSLNGQLFPLACRAFISLVGESMENTILDAEGSTFIYSANKNRNFSIENLSFINGYGIHPNSASLCYFRNPYQLPNSFIHLNNLIFKDNITRGYVISSSNHEFSMNNIIFKDNEGGSQLELRLELNNIENNITNLIIKNCSQYTHPDVFSATPIFIFGYPYTNNHKVNLANILITDNQDLNNDWPESCSGIHISNNVDVDMVNCTFSNNSTTPNGGVILGGLQGNTINIYNSIFYGDFPRELYLGNLDPDNPLMLNIYNSLVDDGEDNIFIIPDEEVIINWDDTTNLDEDPLWLGTGDYPYYLQSASPCIDVGTLDLPAGIELPQYDLAGNQRIYGDTIDMGAYEWQGVETQEDEIPTINETRISNYPNPFNPSTTIKLELVESGEIELAIYNIKGQKMRTLIDAFTNKGTFKANWNGKDEQGKPVSSGLYVVKLQKDGKETATKIMLLK